MCVCVCVCVTVYIRVYVYVGLDKKTYASEFFSVYIAKRTSMRSDR